MLYVTIFFVVLFERVVLFHITTGRSDRSGKRDLSVLSGFLGDPTGQSQQPPHTGA